MWRWKCGDVDVEMCRWKCGDVDVEMLRCVAVEICRCGDV